MTIATIHNTLTTHINGSHHALSRDLAALRTGRASSSLLDSIKIDYYGAQTPIAQVANISVADARLLTVKPWDRGSLKVIESAIRKSDMNLNPSVDGDLIRIPLPPLTTERRQDLIKIARSHGEDCKVAIRRARHTALDALAASEGSDDELSRAKKTVEELVASAITQVATIVVAKEKDILT